MHVDYTHISIKLRNVVSQVKSVTTFVLEGALAVQYDRKSHLQKAHFHVRQAGSVKPVS